MKRLLLLIISLIAVTAVGFSFNRLLFEDSSLNGSLDNITREVKKEGFVLDKSRGDSIYEFTGKRYNQECLLTLRTDNNKEAVFLSTATFFYDMMDALKYAFQLSREYKATYGEESILEEVLPEQDENDRSIPEETYWYHYVAIGKDHYVILISILKFNDGFIVTEKYDLVPLK